MNRFALFATACILGGIGGFAGSVLGSGLGKQALFIGGYIGGVAIAPLTAWVAVRRRWIDPTQHWPVAIGTAGGFILAATLATNTLSSPAGPLVATTLTGLGALAGARRGSGSGSGTGTNGG